MPDLKCFVAMAFGHKDTDVLYDQWIRKCIEGLGVKPIRIDRINHNKRIDQKIRDELQEADLMVSDLTYARQSVYYEAGFAERILGEKVIYTARSDHFGGLWNNKRIHFDLANANIITWSKLGDLTFYNLLEDRLRLVAGRLLNDQETERKLFDAEKVFSKLSLEIRKNAINEKMRLLLSEFGFKRVRNNLLNNMEYYSTFDDILIVISLVPCDVWTMSKLVSLRPLLSSSNYSFLNIEGKDMELSSETQIHRIRKIVLLPSTSNVKIQNIETTFSYLSRSDIQGHYFYPHVYKDLNEPFLPTSSELLVINEIKSALALENWFKYSFDKLLVNLEALETPVTFM